MNNYWLHHPCVKEEGVRVALWDVQSSGCVSIKVTNCASRTPETQSKVSTVAAVQGNIQTFRWASNKKHIYSYTLT